MRTEKPKQTVFDVPVLTGAAEELVLHREMRARYQTNRSIKVWSCFFLLKSVTTSGYIKNWISQRDFLLDYCKLNENTFRAHLKSMKKLGLITLGQGYDITLISFEKAATILGIPYSGTYKIKYNPTHEGKQIFQYFLRAEEIRSNQAKQLNALVYKAGKNPLLRQNLMLLLSREGHSEKQLKDPQFFQQKLLKLQEKAFRYGSETLGIVHSLRADINRGVKRIQFDHKYLSPQSVSYMKQVMVKLGLISVEKKMVTSKERCRLYVPDGAEKVRDGYKWLKAKQETAWRLTDQVTVKFQTVSNGKKEAAEKSAAA